MMFLSTTFAFCRLVFFVYFQKPDWICSVFQDLIVLVECLGNLNKVITLS